MIKNLIFDLGGVVLPLNPEQAWTRFESLGIKNTRHAVSCGLLADLAGVIAAIAICYLFFA